MQISCMHICTQGVFFPGSGLLTEQGVTGKGLGGIDGLSSGTLYFAYLCFTSCANIQVIEVFDGLMLMNLAACAQRRRCSTWSTGVGRRSTTA